MDSYQDLGQNKPVRVSLEGIARILESVKRDAVGSTETRIK